MSLIQHSTPANGHRQPRLLVIPHVYAEDICVREMEFARRLTRHFDVFCLAWKSAMHIDGKPGYRRRWKQLSAALGTACARRRTCRVADGVEYVVAPVLQPILLQRLLGARPAFKICQRFNRRIVERLVADLRISHVLVASEAFDLPRRREVRGFLDVVDWVPEERLSPDVVAMKKAELKRMARQAVSVFAVSKPLSDKLARDCGITAVPMTNGADIKMLRAVPKFDIVGLRRALGLEGKFVIGYIGNHGSFTGVDFVVNVFRSVRKRLANSALLIVGPAEHWRAMLESARADGVVWTGPVSPSEVGKYFNALDVGILAQPRTLGTDLAFQIKIVEYSACRKFVVSTPLQTWKQLAWPNVLLTEMRVDEWVSAILRVQGARWQQEWDTLVERYDWTVIANNLAAEMVGIKAERGQRCAS
jgi:glycosyltransferase involved in cell wall biosynthesis